MTSQSIVDILQALVTAIETDVTDFKYVTYKPDNQMFMDIPNERMPACIIEVFQRTADHHVTAQTHYELFLGIVSIVPVNTDDDVLYALDEQIQDCLNNNVQLDDTCIYNLEAGSDPPRIWPRDQRKMCFTRTRIRYQRTIT